MGRGEETHDVSILIDSTKDDILKEMLDIFSPVETVYLEVPLA